MNKSMWLDNTDIKTYSIVQKDYEVDVAIIGGNMAAICSAYNLLREGYKVAILESNMVFGDENLNTFGNVTFQTDLVYHQLINRFGLEKTKLFYEAQQLGYSRLLKNMEEINVDCTYQTVNQTFYSNYQVRQKDIEAELQATINLGIDAFFMNNQLTFPNQGQMNVSKYIVKMLWYFDKKDDLYLFEQAKLQSIEETDSGYLIKLKNGYQIKSKFTIITKDLENFVFTNQFINKLQVIRRFVVGIDSITPLDERIYTSIDDGHLMIRNQAYANKNLILLSKSNNDEKNEEIVYRDLREFVETKFGLNKQIYKWSYTIFQPVDQLPIIGRINNNLFIATGFNDTDLIYSHVSANLIKDILLNGTSEFEELFQPNRFN